jgi:two-component system, cell cycle sensor histidine kinase and response regulator CckA
MKISTSVPFEAILDGLDEPILVISRDPKTEVRECVYVNRAFRSFLGISTDFKLELHSFWPQGKEVCTQGELTTEFKLQRSRSLEPEIFPVKLQLSSVGQGAVLVRILAGIDGRETLHRFHSQRLETLGMLAGGIAHDFNNILAGILGHTTYLKTVLPGSGIHVESLNAIEEGGKKASLMTQQILNFSRLDTSERIQPVQLSELINKTLVLMKGAITAQYPILYTPPSSEIRVLGVEGELAQVLINLLINARDALLPGGTITVSLELIKDREIIDRAFANREHAAGSFARLRVVDVGHGMSPEVLKKIFEPYFSTKKGKGTGLGLATVQAIIRHCGGAIEVQSKEGIGTTVSVYVPAIESSATQAATTARPKLQRGTEHILVIDDEYPVRNVLAVSLQHLGYEVVTAASGVEALELLPQLSRPIDLVLLDMLMPNLPGEKVFVKLREMAPQLKVLVMSGYSSEEAVESILKNGGVGFIQKPFTIEELASKVRQCL